ncbi:MAG: exodeoxyribonuclease III [Pyrinomonadaceae bacterium]
MSSLKVATWNINGINSRLRHILDWSARNDPDLLCLQELKCSDSRFPLQRLRSAGFPHIEFLGEKAYNGVAILSQHPLEGTQRNLPDDLPESPRRLLSATIRGVRIVNVYAPHGTKLGSEKFRYKIDWLRRLRSYLDSVSSPDEEVLLCGDLNVAPHELDVWKPSVWREKLHFTKEEREALLHVKRWGFVDVFRQMNDDVKQFSWWSNFHNDFEKDRGLRIDLIWASQQIAEACTGSWIDKVPRGWDRPSDHAPVVAEFLI